MTEKAFKKMTTTQKLNVIWDAVQELQAQARTPLPVAELMALERSRNELSEEPQPPEGMTVCPKCCGCGYVWAGFDPACYPNYGYCPMCRGHCFLKQDVVDKWHAKRNAEQDAKQKRQEKAEAKRMEEKAMIESLTTRYVFDLTKGTDSSGSGDCHCRVCHKRIRIRKAYRLTDAPGSDGWGCKDCMKLASAEQLTATLTKIALPD